MSLERNILVLVECMIMMYFLTDENVVTFAKMYPKDANPDPNQSHEEVFKCITLLLPIDRLSQVLLILFSTAWQFFQASICSEVQDQTSQQEKAWSRPE